MCDIFGNLYLIFRKIHKDAIVPYKSEADYGNAGYELCSVADITIHPNEDVLVPTGLQCEFSPGFVMIIKDKSGRRWKNKLQTGAGVIDSNYRNEIMVLLKNISNQNILILKGQSVAQFIVIPCWNGVPGCIEETLSSTARKGGFGSTSDAVLG